MTDITLINSAIRRQVLLEQLKSHQTEKFLRAFRDFEKMIKSSFADLDEDLLDLNRRQLNNFMKSLEGDLEQIFEPYTKEYFEELEELAGVFSTVTATDLKSAIGGDTKINKLSSTVAFRKGMDKPMSANGKLLKPFFNQMTNREAVRVTDSVRKGFTEGQTNQEIVKSLIGTKKLNFNDGILKSSRRNAKAVVRTATQHMANVARVETYTANADIVTGYKILATLDSKTSPQCRALDQQEFELGKGPMPPLHVNCRTTTTPVLDEEFDFLNDNGTRSSSGGPLEADTSYYEWLDSQPEAVKLKVLGKERYDLFTQPGMTVERFRKLQLDKHFQPMTLDEMKSLDPDAFKGVEEIKAVNLANRPKFSDRRAEFDRLILEDDVDGFREAVKMPEGLRSNIRIRSVTSGAKGVIDKATDFLNEVLPPEMGARISRGVVRAEKTRGRAHYLPVTKSLTVGPRVSTAIHEMSHSLEFQSKKLSKKTKSFLKKRANGEQAQKLSVLTGISRYEAREIAFKDKWEDLGGSVYTGKLYNNDGTEIISMGMERLYANPLKFAKEDPEYFDFLIQVLQHSED